MNTFNVRVGSVLPVLRSATGRVFAAFSNDPQLSLLIDEEILHMRRHKLTLPDMSLEALQTYLSSVRSRGYAKVVGTLLQGVSAYSAPVFNHHSELAGAITILGPDQVFTAARESEVLRHLPEAARRRSELLGYDGGH